MPCETCTPSRRGSSALAGLFLLALAACGGGGGGEIAPPPAQDAGALAVSQPGEVTRYAQQRLRTLSAQGKLGTGGGLLGGPATSFSPSPTAAAPPPRSTTIVQEDAVDEADLLQTDGTHLYTLQPQAGAGAKVAVYRRASDGRATPLKQLSLATDGAMDVSTDGMFLSADQRSLAVVSQHWSPMPPPEVCDGCPTTLMAWMRSSVNVQRLDVSTPASAEAGERISIDGFLVDSRRIGDSLVVVTSHRPALAVDYLPSTASAAEREAAIARLTSSDLLPRLRRNGGTSVPLVADTDCYVQTANASQALQFTTITVFDLRSPTLPASSRCFVGGSEALYMSPANLYVATTRWDYPIDVVALVYPGSIKTDIHKFALAGGAVSYRGSGQVEGHLGWDPEKKSYRLSEHNGDLRVLSFSGEVGWLMTPDPAVAPSPARLSVLRERSSDQTLQTVATLPNAARPGHIGKSGEQVYAVRFVGDRGYVVTFRRTDPLYVLDLSNPADPKTVGELEVAGFSEYLFPLANGLLLGAGRDAESSGRVTGLKLALFDVSDPAKPSQRAALTLGAAGSTSSLDSSRHGLNMLVIGSTARIALPVNLSSSAFSGWQSGLQRLEVDTAAGTMRSLGLLGAASNSGNAPLWLERSAQIGDNVYHLGGGTLQTYAW